MQPSIKNLNFTLYLQLTTSTKMKINIQLFKNKAIQLISLNWYKTKHL